MLDCVISLSRQLTKSTATYDGNEPVSESPVHRTLPIPNGERQLNHIRLLPT